MSKQEKRSESQAQVIYLGMDVHVEKYVVVRQIDALMPQPAQCFRSEQKLLQWVIKQKLQAKEVVACYEAGPTGYGLYRELRRQGIRCHVVAPKKWSENDDQVKTDKRDAKILCQRLERYEVPPFQWTPGVQSTN